MRAATALLALLLSGCATAPGGPVPDPVQIPRAPALTSTQEPTVLPTPARTEAARLETAPPLPPGGTPVPLDADRLEAIRADLERRDAPTDDLVVVSARALTWNDGSWGCPQPDTAYPQAVVQGLQVIVEAGAVQHDYRFGGDSSEARLCLPRSQR